jgi:hypothetical protein
LRATGPERKRPVGRHGPFGTLIAARPGGTIGDPAASCEEDAMAEAAQWRLTGDWFDVCRCRVPCGCTFAQPPDEEQCDGVLAWHIREGHYGDVRLDGLNVAAVGSFRGNIWAGDTKLTMGMFIDERADEAQREALETIFAGHAGGWPAGFAELVGEQRGVERARIDIEIADDLARWRVEVPGRVRGSAEALTGPTSPSPDARVQVLNAPGAEVGPGQVATYATATEDEVDAFGFRWSWPGRSSKHFPFDWSGPDGA